MGDLQSEEEEESDGLDYSFDYDRVFLMMYQLIGVPTLNQFAKEVPSRYKSLTSTGIYVLITASRTFFWIGEEYYRLYLDDSSFKKLNLLISESLLS